jgi:hypothetical protein
LFCTGCFADADRGRQRNAAMNALLGTASL